MKYLLLVHHDETAFALLSETTQKDMLQESIQLTHALDAQGRYVHASPLPTADSATIVRMREGKALITDGPFIETKEQIAGYFLIDAADRAEAVAIAQRIPGARFGSVEVRAVTAVDGLPHE